MAPVIRERLAYLNAWLFVRRPSGVIETFHVLGTGSSSALTCPNGFAPNTVAFNPYTWSGSSTTFSFGVPIPSFPEDRLAVLRLRLDYGEDCGNESTCMSRAGLAGPCGPARYGEVEDHPWAITGVP